MDIDGTYIKDEKYMVEDNQVKKGFKYYPSEIHAYSKDKIITRNNKKSGVMNVLSSTNQISAIDYRAYYFCCNLDHILYNEANLESSLKNAMPIGKSTNVQILIMKLNLLILC